MFFFIYLRSAGRQKSLIDMLLQLVFMEFTLLVIQSEAKNLGYIHVCGHLCVTEILPPFGRLNDR